MDTLKKAREFYGIYDYVSDNTVERLVNLVKENGIEYVKNNTSILKRLSQKKW